MKKNWEKELNEKLHQFARFAVIGFRGIKAGKELKFFNDYVKGFSGHQIRLFVNDLLNKKSIKILEKNKMIKREILLTLIQCPMCGKNHDCCGCLYGEIKKTRIDFKCGECGYNAGYITLKELIKLLKKGEL